MVKDKSRIATARCIFGYYDGKILKIIEGSKKGEVADEPSGSNGWDWDQIFIPEGSKVTMASLNDEDYQKTYLEIKPFAELKEFLATIN